MDQQPKLLSSPANIRNYKAEHINSTDRQLYDHGSSIGMTKQHDISCKKSVSNNTTPTHAGTTSAPTGDLTNCENKSSIIPSKNSTSSSNNNNSNSGNNNNNNNINQSNTTIPCSNILKYLHKKFKRIASATPGDIVATSQKSERSNSTVEDFQNEESRFDDSSKQSLVLHVNSSATSKSNHVLLNGNARPSPLSSSSSPCLENQPIGKNFTSTDIEKTGSYYGGQNYIPSNYSIHNSQSANETKISTNSSESLVNSVTSQKSEAAARLSDMSKSNIRSSNDDVTHVLATSATRTSSPTALATANTIVSENYQKIIQQHQPQQQHQQQQLPLELRSQQRELDQSPLGRYVCPYCNLNCTKPSVLQKHIRAHTNERPYPCDTCGFAFKTKSNYYKHCRSKVHALRIKCGDSQPDDDGSLGSNHDPDPELSNSSSDVISRTTSPLEERTSSPVVQSQAAQQQFQKYGKPYKPKFHSAAAFYAKEELLQLQQQEQQQPQQKLQQQQYEQHQLPHLRQLQLPQLPQSLLQQLHRPEQQAHQQQQSTHQQLLLNNNQYHNEEYCIQNQPIQPLHIQGMEDQSSLQYHHLPFRNHSDSTHPHIHQYRASNSLTYPYSTTTSRVSVKISYIEGTGHSSSANTGGHPLNVELLQEHISKIISQNEAIVENKEMLLRKKYPKITGKSLNSNLDMTNDNSNSKLACALTNRSQHPKQHQQISSNLHEESYLSTGRRGGSASSSASQHSSTLGNNTNPLITIRLRPQILNSNQQQLQQQQSQPTYLSQPQESTTLNNAQPLNLTKFDEQQQKAAFGSSSTTRPLMDSFVTAVTENVAAEPPKITTMHLPTRERSIIKDLLLNSRGLGVPNGEGEDAVYTCPLCRTEFRSAEDLKLHTSSYCTSVVSLAASPSSKFLSSELSNPNTLEKLAQSSLLRLSRNPLSLVKLAWSQLKIKPSNLVLNQLSINTTANSTTTSATSTSSSTTTALASALTPTSNVSASNSVQKLIDVPLPSPGPLLGKTPLIDAYNNSDRKNEDVIITRVHDEDKSCERNLSPKRLRLDNFPQQIIDKASQINHIPSISPSVYSDAQSSLTPASTKSFSMYGGDVKLLDKKEERMKRFQSSGGCIIPISVCSDAETSPKMILTPLLSGGCFTEVSSKIGNKESPNMAPSAPKVMIPATTSTPTQPAPLLSAGLQLPPHFQFPPINSITAFNPLTLPPVSMSTITTASALHDDKLIPFVPGIPGPNTLALPPLSWPPQKEIVDGMKNRNVSSNCRTNSSPNQNQAGIKMASIHDIVSQHILHITTERSPMRRTALRVDADTSFVENVPSLNNECLHLQQKSPRNFIQYFSSQETTPSRKSFNFTQVADNLSPHKPANIEESFKSPKREMKYFNFENIISKPEIILRSPWPQVQQQWHLQHSQQQQTQQMQLLQLQPRAQHQQQPQRQQHQHQLQTRQQIVPLNVDITSTAIFSSQTVSSQEPSENEITRQCNKTRSKFLRPTTLPLKPGTFTPKRHHGITPTTNTLPLISPETPRPSKAYIQQFLNGHAYTYLGLKCSTKMFYCTINCPQASYIANVHHLSMYSKWQTCAENNPHPFGFKPKTAMALYDSRQRSFMYSIAKTKSPYTTLHSQQAIMTPFENNQGQFYHHQIKSVAPPVESSAFAKSENSQKSNGSSILVGGYESNENYTYIRGRGRGRYVCSECGIRCKKPSMLKKHIRTHTDVRPYTCSHCSFSFKTKGNLTKHMRSKTHYKKCIELGINLGPMPPDIEFMDIDCDMDQQSNTSGGGRTSSVPGESDSDDYSDYEDVESESNDTDESKSRLQEHEAARCLLSLSKTSPSNSVSPQMFQRKYQTATSPQQVQEQIVDEIQIIQSQRNVADDLQNPRHNSLRKIISFTSTEPPFEYQKQEQYYSNPIIPKGREGKFHESTMKPIDLTKPRHIEQDKVTKIIDEYSTETGLLKSLFSITDKIRNTTREIAQNTNKFDGNVLLQAYLTEQALKYSKIKQCQMNEIVTMTTASTTQVTSTPGIDTNEKTSFRFNRSINVMDDNNVSISLKLVTNCGNVATEAPQSLSMQSEWSRRNNDIEVFHRSKQEETVIFVGNQRSENNENCEPLQNDVQSSDVVRSNSSQNRMTVLTGNVQNEQLNSDGRSNPKTIPLPLNITAGGAKSVASEYLKMTSANSLKSRNGKTDDNEENYSDQEVGENENSNTNTKPPPDFSGVIARTVIVSEDGFKCASNEVQVVFPRVPISVDGRPVCTICSKTFQKQHQMVLHMNIHYMERKFKCELCTVSFRTQGHLQKHERSEAHKNKIMMTSAFGVPTTSNPRPFECSDCKVAFRIHGHLAKHLRSKTHVQKLECLQKLPFGTYAEIERAGISLTEIDTTDCDQSLASLKVLAQKLIGKDPNKLSTYMTPSCVETNSSGALSHESGSEDSPDTQYNNTSDNNIISSNNSSGINIAQHSSGGIQIQRIGTVVKRKLDSFNSSCSNDFSISNNISFTTNSNNNQQLELGLEKRIKTTTGT